jgi:hypothetical protein
MVVHGVLLGKLQNAQNYSVLVCWWSHISVNEQSLCDLMVKNLRLGL